MLTDKQIQQLRNENMGDAADEIERLRTAMEEVRHIAEGMRTWNGQGWTYHPPQAMRIYDAANSALSPGAPVHPHAMDTPSVGADMLERHVRAWSQSGFAVVSKIVFDEILPMVHSFHTARGEAESDLNKLTIELPEHLRVDVAVKPAQLTFEA
jgi:hypothetical protein